MHCFQVCTTHNAFIRLESINVFHITLDGDGSCYCSFMIICISRLVPECKLMDDLLIFFNNLIKVIKCNCGRNS